MGGWRGARLVPLGLVMAGALLAGWAVAAAAPAARAAGTAPVAPAAYPGADGRIAFVRAGDIFTIEPDGTGSRRLTSSHRTAGPRWSPNGTKIAYLNRGNLWVMTETGADKTQITRAAPAVTDGRPTWSPNGRYLAFVESRRGQSHGNLTRYDTVTHRFVSYTDTIESPHRIKVAALAGLGGGLGVGARCRRRELRLVPAL